jgi:hypothetical protein
MKYRELSPSEIEAYNVGYKVGNRQIIITDIEWESEEEHKIYRKGYMAGLMDYKRNVSNVSKVNNVDIATPTTPISISNSISISNTGIDNKGVVGGKEEREVSPEEKAANIKKVRQIVQETAQTMKRQPDQVTITRDNVILHGLLRMYLSQTFGEQTMARARDWMIDHVAGQTWNATRIIKLMCKWTGRQTHEAINKWADFVILHKNQDKNQNNS